MASGDGDVFADESGSSSDDQLQVVTMGTTKSRARGRGSGKNKTGESVYSAQFSPIDGGSHYGVLE